MESQSEFQGNQQHVESQEVYKEPKKQMNYESSTNSGPWTHQQNMKYIIFVDKNRHSLTSRSKRRVNKIFKEMSLLIGTRNAIQCRSHHQKQLDKLKNISKIIEVFKKNFDHLEYDNKVQQLALASLNTKMRDSVKQKRQSSNQNQIKPYTQVQTNIAGIDLNIGAGSHRGEKRQHEPIYYDFQTLMGIMNFYNCYSWPSNMVNIWGPHFCGDQA